MHFHSVPETHPQALVYVVVEKCADMGQMTVTCKGQRLELRRFPLPSSISLKLVLIEK